MIDGENFAVGGPAGEDLGYLVGWTSRKIPVAIRPMLLTLEVPGLELDPWVELLRDRTRDLPQEVTMIFWEGLPLAVWVPSGRLKSSSFNPN